MSKVNKKLLRETLRFIKRNPEKHDQNNRCGAAQCFAGWACHLDGWRRVDRHEADALDACYEFPVISSMTVKLGSMLSHPAEVAASILGLDEDDADRLFASQNSVDDLDRIVTELCR